MPKEKSKLAKILQPKLSSFLPIGLGINTAKYSKEESIKANPDNNEKQLKRNSIFTGVVCEGIRDMPTIFLLYSGATEASLIYYALATYICDRI